MASDLKDQEIRRLKQQISQLEKEMIQRTCNYLFNIQNMKVQGKVVYTVNPQCQQDGRRHMEQSAEERTQQHQKQLQAPNAGELLNSKDRELVRKNRELKDLQERLLSFEAKFKELSTQASQPPSQEKSIASQGGEVAKLRQEVKDLREELKGERRRIESLQTEKVRLESQISIEKGRRYQEAGEEDLRRKAIALLTEKKESQEQEISMLKQSVDDRVRQAESLRKELQVAQASNKQKGLRSGMTEGELKMKEQLKEKIQKIRLLQDENRELLNKVKALSQQVEPVPLFDSQSEIEQYKKQASQDRVRYESHVTELTKRMEEEVRRADMLQQNSDEKSQQLTNTISELQESIESLRQQLRRRQSEHTDKTNRLIEGIEQLNHQNEQNISKLVEKDDNLISEEQLILQLRGRIEDLQGELKRQQAEFAEERAGLQANISKLEEAPRSDNLLLPPEERLRRSQRLTEQIKELTKNTTEKESQLIEYLKRENDNLRSQLQQTTGQLASEQSNFSTVEKQLREELAQKSLAVDTLASKIRGIEDERRTVGEAVSQLQKKLAEKRQLMAEELQKAELLRAELQEVSRQNVLLKGNLASKRHERESSMLQEGYYTQEMIRLGDQNKVLVARVAELEEQLKNCKVNYETDIGQLNCQLQKYRSEGEYLRTMGMEGDSAQLKSYPSPLTQEQKKEEIQQVIEKLSKEDMKLKQISSVKERPRELRLQEGKLARKRKFTSDEGKESYPMAEGQQVGVLQSELAKLRRELAETRATYDIQLQQQTDEYMFRTQKKNKELLEMEGKIEQQEARIKELSAQTAHQEEVIGEMTRQSQTLRGEKGEKLEQLVSRINELEGSNAELLEQIDKHRSQQVQLKQELWDRQERSLALEICQEQSRGLKKLRAELEHQLSEKQQQLQLQQANARQLESQINSRDSIPQIVVSTEVQTSDQYLEKQGSSIEASTSESPQQVASLQLSAVIQTLSAEQVDQLGKRIVELQQENTRLEGDLQQLHAKNKELENELSMFEVRVSNTNLSSEIKLKARETQILEGTEEIDRLTQELERVTNLNTDLEVQKIALEEQVAELQKQKGHELEKQTSKAKQQKGKSRTPVKPQQRSRPDEEEPADRRKQNKELGEKINEAVKEYIAVNEKLNSQIDICEKEKTELASKLEDIRHQLHEAQRSLQVATQKNENYEQVVQRLHRELQTESESSKRSEGEAKRSIAELQSRVRELEAFNFKSEAEQMKSKLQELRSTAPVVMTAVPLGADSREQDGQLLQMKAALEKCERERDELVIVQASAKAESTHMVARYEQQIESYKEYIISLNNTIATLKQSKDQELAEAISQANLRVVSKEEQLSRLSQKLAAMAGWQQRYQTEVEQVKQCRETMASLQQQIAHLEGIIAEWQKTHNLLLEEHKSRVTQIEEELMLKLKSEKLGESEIERIVRQRESQIQKLEAQLHESLEHQSELLLRMKSSRASQDAEALQARIAELEKERQTLIASLPEIYMQVCALQEKNAKDAGSLKELVTGIQMDRLQMKALEERLRESDGLVGKSSQNLESEKRILKEIEEIEKWKKERQDEMDEAKKTYHQELASLESDIAELRKANKQLGEDAEDQKRKIHELEAELQRAQKKMESDQSKQTAEEHRLPETIQLSKQLSTLKSAYNFVNKRSLKYGQMIEEAEGEKLLMFREVEHYKTLAQKTSAENRALKEAGQKAQLMIASYQQKDREDFKEFADASFEQQLEMQRRLQRMSKEIALKDKQIAQKSKEMAILSAQAKDFRRGAKLEELVDYHTPQPEDNSTFESLDISFKKDLEKKVQTAQSTEYLRRLESSGPMINRCELSDPTRHERELSKLKQDLNSSNLQLTSLKHNFELSERERNRLQLVQEEQRREVEQLRKRCAIFQQQNEYQRKRTAEEFSQFVSRIARANWKMVSEPESGVRARRISLDKSMYELTQELRRQEEVFRRICSQCFEIFESLPETSTDILFVPETEEDLMIVLRDIRSISGSYKQRETASQLQRVKRDETYNNLIVGLLGARQIEEEKLQEMLEAIPKEQFESLLQKVKSYYKRQRERETEMSSSNRPDKLATSMPRSSKKVGLGEEMEFREKNFYSGSEEFFDIKEPASSADFLRKESELREYAVRLEDAEFKLKQRDEQLATQLQLIDQLRKVEERCLKEHKKSLLVQKGREFD